MDIKDLMKFRFLFLHKLYEFSKSNKSLNTEVTDIFKELKLKESDEYSVVNYLLGNSLIKKINKTNFIQITSIGIEEVIELLDSPENATKNFLPLNSIDFAIDSTSLREKQKTEQFNPLINFSSQLQKIYKITLELRKYDNRIILPLSQHTELFCEVATIEAQLKSPNPKKIIFIISLKTIKSLLETYKVDVIKVDILKLIEQLVNYQL